MKRTPRSAKRRAIRQLLAKDPSPGVHPYSSSIALLSSRQSASSGTSHLHSEGQFVLGDSVGDFWVVDRAGVFLIQIDDRLDDLALALVRDTIWGLHVVDGLSTAVPA